MIPGALWIDWQSLELIRETEKAKKSGRNGNTELEVLDT